MKKLLCLVIALVIFIPTVVSAQPTLSKLNVEGIGDLGVNTRKTWNLEFSTSYDYINIIAEASEEGLQVTGAGKVPVKEGANTLIVSVADASGNKTDYTLNLNVTKLAAGQKAITNPNTGAFIGVGCISLVAIAGALIIVKSKANNKLYKI